MSNIRFNYYPLHTAILARDDKELAKQLADRSDCKEECLVVSINESNRHHFSPLQLASEQGHIPAALLLLLYQANIDLITEQIRKQPLYLAIERGHSLLTKILVSAGARRDNVYQAAEKSHDKKIQQAVLTLEPDRATIRALLFWAVTHPNPNTPLLITTLLREFSEAPEEKLNEASAEESKEKKEVFIPIKGFNKDKGVADFLILAAFLNNRELINVFQGQVRPDKHCDSSVRTIAYWAEKKGNPGLRDAVYRNGEAKAIARKQLADDAKNPDDQKCFYELAASGAKQERVREDEMTVEYYMASLKAFNKNDYVALFNFKKILPQSILFGIALEKNNLEFAKFLLITADIDSYKMALAYRDDRTRFSNLLNIITPRELHYQMLTRNMQEEQAALSKDETALHQKLIPLLSENEKIDNFLICLHRYFPEDYLHDLREQNGPLEKRLTTLPPQNRLKPLLTSRLERFGFNIPASVRMDEKKQAEKKEEKVAIEEKKASAIKKEIIKNNFVGQSALSLQNAVFLSNNDLFYSIACYNTAEDNRNLMRTCSALLGLQQKFEQKAYGLTTLSALATFRTVLEKLPALETARLQAEINQARKKHEESTKKLEKSYRCGQGISAAAGTISLGVIIFCVYWYITRFKIPNDQVIDAMGMIWTNLTSPTPPFQPLSCADFADAFYPTRCRPFHERNGREDYGPSVPVPPLCDEKCHEFSTFTPVFSGTVAGLVLGLIAHVGSYISSCVVCCCCGTECSNDTYPFYPPIQNPYSDANALNFYFAHHPELKEAFAILSSQAAFNPVRMFAGSSIASVWKELRKAHHNLVPRSLAEIQREKTAKEKAAQEAKEKAEEQEREADIRKALAQKQSGAENKAAPAAGPRVLGFIPVGAARYGSIQNNSPPKAVHKPRDYEDEEREDESVERKTGGLAQPLLGGKKT